jgi:hypothetical protein
VVTKDASSLSVKMGRSFGYKADDADVSPVEKGRPVNGTQPCIYLNAQ